MRSAEPVDRAVYADERGGVEVSDDAVIFDSQVHVGFSQELMARDVVLED